MLGLGAEVMVALVGLWAMFLRPLLMNYTGDMVEVMVSQIRELISRSRSRSRSSSRRPFSRAI
ncbi:unnamed protein product [Prunus armeniaca]|uniref:Uncharacterized protein n=1 Tax=Prunus armeniaca TaxID=36596 RepID=A0A6J5UM58_PRUAR|nr:hypothetical protein GBA52_013891 [Prunus armeniaca]CAB4277576.1 unnamed protein product [Prunus armeniaca]CAB4307968.1 unnamed protein product [Prunus armeniaca]